MELLISAAHADCYGAFERLIEALRHPVRDFGDQLPVTAVEEEFDKYKIWAGNVGAGHFGKRYEISLDYRLREAKFLKDQVLGLLKALSVKVEELNTLVRNERKPFEEQALESDSEISTTSNSGTEEDEASEDSPWEISSDSSAGEENVRTERQESVRTPEGELPEDTPGPTIPKGNAEQRLRVLGRAPSFEVPRLLESIKFTISCLYRMPIRKPAPLDRLKEKATLDASCYQHFDVMYVRDKFPLIDNTLATRLGKLISRRRQILWYRDAHKQRLDTARTQPRLGPVLDAKSKAATPQNPTESNSGEIDIRSVPSGVSVSQTASSYFTLRSKATTVRPGEVPSEFRPEESDPTTLYAPSCAESKSSIASSYTGKDLRVRVPARPRNESGVELEWFECPYCCLTKNISTERRWKKHVFEDLQPYVCTYGDCSLYDHFFVDKETWFKHEAQHHRAKLFCNTEDHPEYETEQDFLAHMDRDHGQKMDEGQFALLKDLFRQPSRSVEGTCNLCMRHSKKLKSHVASHLQQIALFAIPRINETTGSGIAAHNSRLSHSGDKSDNRSESLSSASEPVPSVEQEVEKEAATPASDRLPEDDYEIGPEIPDAADTSWDGVTGKFSHARKGQFRPLKFSIIDRDAVRKTTTIAWFQRLRCIERELYDADVLLLHHPVQEAVMEDLIKFCTANWCPVALIEVGSRGSKELRHIYRSNGASHAAITPPMTSNDLEEVLARVCSWAPPPPGWNPEPLDQNRSNRGSRLVEVHYDDDQPPAEPWIEQYLRDNWSRASSSLRYRIAQNLTAIANQLRRIQKAKAHSVTRERMPIGYEGQDSMSQDMYCNSCGYEWEGMHSSSCSRCASHDICSSHPAGEPTRTFFMWSREAFNPSWNGHAWEIYCPYCGLIVEAPSKPSSLAWRYHILDDIKPFICWSDSCEAPTVRWGDYQAWYEHLEPNLFLIISPEGNFCPLCTTMQTNLKVHMSRHLLDLAEFCCSIYSDSFKEDNISSVIVDICSGTAEVADLSEDIEAIADEDNIDLETIGNCFITAATVPTGGMDLEWAFMGQRFQSTDDKEAPHPGPDTETLLNHYKVRRIRRPEEALPSSDADPYREVLLAKQIQFLDDQVDIKGTFWPLTLSQLCIRLKVQLRTWDKPCDTWDLLEHMLLAGLGEDITVREGFEKQLKEEIQAIKEDYPDMPRFRINDLVARQGSTTIERVINREAKFAGWSYYLVDQLSAPREKHPPKGHWYLESELQPANTGATPEFFEELRPSRSSRPDPNDERDQTGERNTDLVNSDRVSLREQSGEDDRLRPQVVSQNQALRQDENYEDYLMPLLEKQMHILTWAMLDCVSRDETAHLQQDLSKLLNLIKLSEFPYLRWSTFGHVVKSCLWQPSPAFEQSFDQLFMDGKKEIKDWPKYRIGDKVVKATLSNTLHDDEVGPPRTLATNQAFFITGGLYKGTLGWLYSLHPQTEDEYAFEADLISVEPRGGGDKGPRTESEIYQAEFFLPYPCRKSNFCVKTFATIAERTAHETKNTCSAVRDPWDGYHRSAQLEMNSDFVRRRHDPFCRNTDCTESFPTIEARNKHESGSCPYRSADDSPFHEYHMPNTSSAFGFDPETGASTSKQFECPYPGCEMGLNKKSIFATEDEAQAHGCKEHFGCLNECGGIWSVKHLRDAHQEKCEYPH